MAIAYFRISQLPTRVTLNKTGGLVLNQSYPIAEQNQLSIANASGFKGEFLDFFKYQLSEDNITWSNAAIAYVRELVLENTPASANDTIAAAESSNYNLASNIPINTSTDRIIISSLSGYGTLSLNGSVVTVGRIIYSHELPNLEFDTGLGGGAPYAVIGYKCGNHLGFDAAEYTVTINVAILGQIALYSSNTAVGSIDLPPVTPVLSQTDVAEISKGYNGGTATVNVVINSPDLSGPNTDNNYVEIRYGATATKYFDNATFNITVPIGDNGKGYVEVIHVDVDETGSPTSSVVTLTLTEINGDSAKVNLANDEVILTANFN